MRPCRGVGQLLFYRRLAEDDSYLDWPVVEGAVAGRTAAPDFDDAALIAAAAWEQVVRFVEEVWKTRLLHPDKVSSS